jgi:hypothetical protein
MMSINTERTEENPRLQLEINPGRLAEIVGSAVFASTEVVNLHLNSLSDENINRSRPGAGVFYKFRGPELTTDQRRAMHESWILAKAFQEILRAVRHALEEAHVLVALLTKEHKIKSNDTIAGFLKPFQSKAAGLTFPDLMTAVNGLLDPNLDFADSYKSLQAARNCLEHRAGIVGNADTKGAAEFTLSVPRLKIFYLRGSEEIELAAGERVDAGDDRPEVEILMKIETRARSISLGGRLTFTPQEFNEIAFACNYLGQQLAGRLPKPRLSAAPGSTRNNSR